MSSVSEWDIKWGWPRQRWIGPWHTETESYFMFSLCSQWACCISAEHCLRWFPSWEYSNIGYQIQLSKWIVISEAQTDMLAETFCFEKALGKEVLEHGDPRHSTLWCFILMRRFQSGNQNYINMKHAQLLQQSHGNRCLELITMILSEHHCFQRSLTLIGS